MCEPELAHDDADDLAPNIRSQEPSAMQVFLAWEKLRVVYCIVVFLWLFKVMSSLRGDGFDWKRLFGMMFVFNVCFCAGPVAEGYLCCFHVPRMIARWVVVSIAIMGSVLALEFWRSF